MTRNLSFDKKGLLSPLFRIGCFEQDYHKEKI